MTGTRTQCIAITQCIFVDSINQLVFIRFYFHDCGFYNFDKKNFAKHLKMHCFKGDIKEQTCRLFGRAFNQHKKIEAAFSQHLSPIA